MRPTVILNNAWGWDKRKVFLLGAATISLMETILYKPALWKQNRILAFVSCTNYTISHPFITHFHPQIYVQTLSTLLYKKKKNSTASTSSTVLQMCSFIHPILS